MSHSTAVTVLARIPYIANACQYLVSPIPKYEEEIIIVLKRKTRLVHLLTFFVRSGISLPIDNSELLSSAESVLKEADNAYDELACQWKHPATSACLQFVCAVNEFICTLKQSPPSSSSSSSSPAQRSSQFEMQPIGLLNWRHVTLRDNIFTHDPGASLEYCQIGPPLETVFHSISLSIITSLCVYSLTISPSSSSLPFNRVAINCFLFLVFLLTFYLPLCSLYSATLNSSVDMSVFFLFHFLFFF